MPRRKGSSAIALPTNGRTLYAQDGPRLTPEQKIGERVEPQPNGCWLYNGKLDKYGQAILFGERVIVHRWVYEILVGPIPDDHDLHHECLNPGCCNPSHLVALTRSEHMSRHQELRAAA